jgi:hypothetical protein
MAVFCDPPAEQMPVKPYPMDAKE